MLLKKHILVGFLCLNVLGLGPAFADRKITIPFAKLREQLPPDGRPQEIWRGAKKWESASGDFFSFELAEAALGQGIRARKDDRKHERRIGEGLVPKDDHLHAVGGWRAHKQIAHYPDLMDGTFDTDIFLKLEFGNFRCELRNFKCSYNKPRWARITVVPGLILELVKGFVAGTVSDRIERLMAQEADKALNEHPELAAIRDRLHAEIEGGNLVIRIPES